MSDEEITIPFTEDKDVEGKLDELKLEEPKKKRGRPKGKTDTVKRARRKVNLAQHENNPLAIGINTVSKGVATLVLKNTDKTYTDENVKTVRLGESIIYSMDYVGWMGQSKTPGFVLISAFIAYLGLVWSLYMSGKKSKPDSAITKFGVGEEAIK